MSHEFDSGFCVRQPSWHGLETLIPESERPETWDAARPIAGLNWEWETGPLFQRVDTGIVDPVTGEPLYEYREAPDFHVVTRSDTNTVLAADRTSYELINIAEMGEILHALTDQAQLKFETMGALRGGRTIWALIQLGDDMQVGTDPSATRRYLGLVNHCDKRGACKAFQTNIRIVCWNTCSAAEYNAERDNSVATFSHRGNWREHLATAREAIANAQQEAAAWVELAKELQRVQVSEAQAEEFVQRFMPYPGGVATDTSLITARVKKNIDTARIQLREVLHESQTTEGIRGTAYWIVQGATEWLDHIRPFKNRASYVQRTVVDTNIGKQDAMDKIMAIVG